MAVYRETDGAVVREYKVQLGVPLQQIQSKHALIEFIPTQEYGLCLFLDNELQFAEYDEYIYHEMLVHPCLAFSANQTNVCIVGGGDGCAAREVFRWPCVDRIDLIDWDEDMTDLFQNQYSFLNKQSLLDPRIHIEHKSIQDCVHEIRSYDCILVDLLDPDFSKENQLDLWYDVLFLIKQWRKPGGTCVVNLGGILPWKTDTVDQMVSLLSTRVGLPVHVYKVFVPSFAREWCFALIGPTDPMTLPSLPPGLQYLTPQTWRNAALKN
jgi:spermidine synthase